MSTSTLWGIILLLVALVDLIVRFGMPFDLLRVLRVEAALFLLAGFALAILLRRRPAAGGLWRRVQIITAVALVLAGVRAALWVLGIPVHQVNLIVLSLAIGVWIGFWVHRSRHRRRSL